MWYATEKLWAVSHRQHLDSRHATYASQVTARAAQRQGRGAEKPLEISVGPVVCASGVVLRYDTAPRAIVFDLVNLGSGPAILKGVQVHGAIGLNERMLFEFGSMSAFQAGDKGVTIEAGGDPLGPIEVRSERFDDATIHSLMTSRELEFSIRIIVAAEDIIGNAIRRVTMFNWDHVRRSFMPHMGLPKPEASNSRAAISALSALKTQSPTRAGGEAELQICARAESGFSCVRVAQRV